MKLNINDLYILINCNDEEGGFADTGDSTLFSLKKLKKMKLIKKQTNMHYPDITNKGKYLLNSILKFINNEIEPMDMSINEEYEYEKEGGFDHLST